MKSDIIVISSDGNHMEEALEQAEKVAYFKGLQVRDASQLRLLTEEMLGMMRSITGERTGRFWIEDQENEFQLHLQVETSMSLMKKEELLSVSTSGKNEAAKGFMGRIRAFFDPLDWANAPVPVSSGVANPVFSWSMNNYRETLQKEVELDQEGAAEAWDELEKSVVSNIADDVKISIQGRTVEMIILKKIKKEG